MSELDLPNISSMAAPVYVAFILLEVLLVAGKRAKGAYEARDASTSILMGLGSVATEVIFATTAYAAIYGVLYGVYHWSPFDLGHGWWVFALALVLDDLRYYWSHRLQHEIRWGWANHVVHHSSQHFNFSTALRQPWCGFLTGLFVLRLPLVFIGIDPAILAFTFSINLVYQFFIHTESVDRLPEPIEWLLNTPSHHRVHHGRNARYLDANYAGIFIIWDRLFGTFVPEDKAEPVRYGIIHNLGTFNPLRVATHEYVSIFRDLGRRDITLRQKLGYLFGPPGWSHDGSRKSAKELKAEAGLVSGGGNLSPAPAQFSSAE